MHIKLCFKIWIERPSVLISSTTTTTHRDFSSFLNDCSVFSCAIWPLCRCSYCPVFCQWLTRHEGMVGFLLSSFGQKGQEGAFHPGLCRSNQAVQYIHIYIYIHHVRPCICIFALLMNVHAWLCMILWLVGKDTLWGYTC